MPDFEFYNEIEVDEFWHECSKSEKQELIDLLVEEGFVIRKTKQPDDPNRNLLDEEWDNLCYKLQNIRQRMSVDDEQTIKQIISKY
jgi:phosphosulfolactate synthase (CoM biosynthesis protein A)